MSTQGLRDHKKVAEITVHGPDAGKAAGKAKTLTLKAPWLYDGKRGPFDLDNVEHGHKIVKGSYHEDKGPAAPKAAPTPTASGPATVPGYRGAVTGPKVPTTNPLPFLTQANNGNPPDQKAAPPTKPFYVWRCLATSSDHEIAFWLRTEKRWSDKALIKRMHEEVAAFPDTIRQNPADEYEVFARWYSPEEEAKQPSPFHDWRKQLGEPGQ